ncbi:hypothetical protein ESA94_21035 [Lacibacter luteus]|uniref:Uncharacterized protein n=1 Tax=Lacibacter luteus TaxID=2508719 RepID=A0A4Q1CDE0_9BACT|nr:hypothetical protein [Lacibacter luteus]RXK57539.1 hypothetical protein ESA94_21035 [Lacibacter luteus]
MGTDFFIVEINAFEVSNHKLPFQKLVKEFEKLFSAVPLTDSIFENKFRISNDQFDLFFGTYWNNSRYLNLKPVFSDNNNIWSEERIIKFQSRLKIFEYNAWKYLLNRNDIYWDKSLISAVSENIDFKILSVKQNLDWSESLIDQFLDKWDWTELSANFSLPWSSSFLEKYSDRWIWKCSDNSISNYNTGLEAGNIKCISANPQIYWTVEFFEKWMDEIDYWLFARYAKFDIKVVMKYPECFTLKRRVGSKVLKSSDNHIVVQIEETGYEQFLKNPNFILNDEFIEFAKKYSIIINIPPFDYHDDFELKDIVLYDLWTQSY